MKYTVNYEIDVEADNPFDAALQVEEILNDMEFRPKLKVIDENGQIEMIDLDDGYEDMELN